GDGWGRERPDPFRGSLHLAPEPCDRSSDHRVSSRTLDTAAPIVPDGLRQVKRLSSVRKLRGRIVRTVAEGIHGRPELRAARFARLLQLPGLPPEAPALGMEPAGLRQVRRGCLRVPARAEELAEPEAGRRPRVRFAGNGLAAAGLLFGQGI